MTRITTPFGFSTTAAEVAGGIDLTGRRAVVTGASSGIGIETARVLASVGAEVTLAVRNTDGGDKIATEIAASTGNKNIHVARLDLSYQDSVAAFVNSWDGPLHLLINNAGVLAIPELQRTSEGWEMQFATNHMGHFALANGLHGALAADGDARVVVVASQGHLISPVVFDDINYRYRAYEPIGAYGQSKTATVQFAVAAQKRWAADGITVNALAPGAIATNLQKHTGGLRTPQEQRKTVEQGAATTILVATSPQLAGVGGRYFEDCNEAVQVLDGNGWARGVAPYALDAENADRIWETSHRFLREAGR
ncbi:SDR family NAD(P)-dependent oxidoreductase [Actinospica robiniae]|uniref:SDR family NAD(P)-dependent oxidoreductase n=1 Tax=Actinospica robiniae TaxID=304901 RepID=UPI00040339D5